LIAPVPQFDVASKYSKISSLPHPFPRRMHLSLGGVKDSLQRDIWLHLVTGVFPEDQFQMTVFQLA